MITTLETIAEIRMGYPFRSRLRHDPQGEVEVIQMKDIDEANVLRVDQLTRTNLPDVKAHHLVRRGDLLFRSRGQTNTVAIVDHDREPMIVAAPLMVIRISDEAALPAFIAWFINHPATQATLSRDARGTSVRMIGKAALDALQIPLPTLARQNKIVQTAELATREQQLMRELALQQQTYVEGILMRYARDTR